MGLARLRTHVLVLGGAREAEIAAGPGDGPVLAAVERVDDRPDRRVVDQRVGPDRIVQHLARRGRGPVGIAMRKAPALRQVLASLGAGQRQDVREHARRAFASLLQLLWVEEVLDDA